MTTPPDDGDSSGLTVATLVGLLAVLVVVLGFALGVYALTPADQRHQLIEDVRPYIGGVLAGIPGVIAVLKVRTSHRQTTAQLATVVRQTNGELGENVATAMRPVVEEVFDQKLAARRSTDPAPEQRSGTAADRRGTAPATPRKRTKGT